MSESNLEKFNRLFDNSNFVLNGKRRTDKNGYSLTYEVIDNRKNVKLF